MRIKLSKCFRFESAHRLAKGYVGKCSNIHGHSWNGLLEVSTEKLDEFGMGVDYSVLGKLLKGIEAELDHKILLHEADADIIKLCGTNDWAYVTFKENPTSEVIAAWIYDIAVAYFSSEEYAHVKIEKVVVNETCTVACTITK